MDDKNTKKLFNKFKTFLKKKNLKAGFECQDGWYQILFNMCTEIVGSNPPEDFRITKICEKYGELKVYSIGGTCATRCYIDEAIELAGETCQHCGNNKDLQQCDKCKETNPDVGTYVPDIKAAVTLPVSADDNDDDDIDPMVASANPTDYYFKAETANNVMVTGMPNDWFTITPKAYWDANHLIYDDDMPAIEAFLHTQGFDRLQESEFEYNGTSIAGHAALLALGFIENLSM